MPEESTPAIPIKQKAWVAARKGTPAKAVELQDIDVPKLVKGEVLVKVQAGALNPGAYKMMNLLPNRVSGRPHIAEHDLTGVIADANGTKWNNGQEVFGFVDFRVQMKGHQGALAQYIRVPTVTLSIRPPSIKPTEAAGLGLAGLTAYQMIKAGKLEAGQSVFINGCTTAVGIFAIQLAKAIGCTVTASASTQKEEVLKKLGVDRFVDYTKGPIHEQLEKDPPTPKFHLFLEAVGVMDIPMYTQCEAYLAPGGTFASVGPQTRGAGVFHAIKFIATVLRPRFLGGTKRDWKLVLLDSNSEDWETFTKYIIEGKVKGMVDSVYAFEDVQKAYDRIMTGRATGKIVVKVDPAVE